MENLRQTIKGLALEAEEGLSDGMPAFRYRGRPLVGCAAFKTHCGSYPMSPDVIEACKDDLKGYESAKGTIRLNIGEPLPDALVERLIKARMQEIDSK